MSDQPKQKFAWTLWVPVILAFVLVATAWFFLIKIAKENPTEVIEIQSSQPD